MSIYSINTDLPAIDTVDVADTTFVYDDSAGRMKRLTVAESRVLGVTAATTAAALSNNGIATLTSSANKAITIAAPVAGCMKILVATHASTVIRHVTTSTTAVTFDGTKRKLAFNGAGDAVILVGRSATRWDIVSNVGSVVTST